MKNKFRVLFLLVLLFGVMISLNNESEVSAKVSTLKVSGTKIVNSKGKTVTLKGVSTHGIAWFPQYVNKKCFKSFKKMGANTVRLALYSDSGAGYSTFWYSKVEKGIKIAKSLGMYVIVDWHILSDGNPNTNKAEAKKFFKHFASRFGKYNNVLYEICNEPNGDVTWERDIKPYAKSMIKVIRKYAKKAIIIVGTPTWSQDVDIVASSPLKNVKNVMYALHFYADTHRDNIRNKLITANKAGLPVFVSEYSISDASGNGSINKKEGSRWMSLLKRLHIGHIAWSVCNKAESSALIKSSCSKTTNIKKKDLTSCGKWIVSNW